MLGIACDGCSGGDGTPQTWEITRFEYNDQKGNDFPAGTHFSKLLFPLDHVSLQCLLKSFTALYKNDDGTFGIQDTNNVNHGSCTRPTDVSNLMYSCEIGLSSRTQGVEIFHCKLLSTFQRGNRGLTISCAGTSDYNHN